MRKLNLQDAAFLQVETDECPAHIAGLQIFKLPKADNGTFFRKLMEKFSNGLEATPPFTWKLHSDVLRLNVWPSWVEDDQFDLDYHVRYTALPSPGSMDQLMKLVERLHSRPLDRTRPLWECYFIEGLADNHVAIYLKIHHACMDGVAAMSVMERVLSKSPRTKLVKAFWQIERPKREEAPKGGLMETLAKTYFSVAGQVRSLQELSTGALKSGIGLLTGAQRDAPMPFTAPSTPFNAAITRHRRFAVHTLSLPRVRAIARDLNMTINDVVLAICAGALRRYLHDHDLAPKTPLVAMCPVSVRPKDAVQEGNQISMIVTTLATDEPNPINRIRRISASSKEGKARISAMSSETATNYALLMNGAVLLSQAIGVGDKVAPPANLVISNVPGPRQKLYLMGAELVHNYPLSVLVHGQALNITVTSYENALDFGLLAAREAVPDVDKLAAYLGDACDELESADETMLEAEVERARLKLAQARAEREQIRAAELERRESAKRKPKKVKAPKKKAADQADKEPATAGPAARAPRSRKSKANSAQPPQTIEQPIQGKAHHEPSAGTTRRKPGRRRAASLTSLTGTLDQEIETPPAKADAAE